MATTKSTPNSSNFGLVSACGGYGEPLHMVFASQLKADGSKNCVAKTDALNKAQFDALFENETMQDRWLILENVSKVSPISEANITDTSDPRITRNLSKGRRGWTFSVVVDDPQVLEKKFADNACRKEGLYIITECGKLVGIKSGEDLCGRKIARIETQVINTSVQNGTASEVLVTVEFLPTELDSSVDYVKTDADEDLTERTALIDVEIASVVLTTNTISFDLETCNGDFNNRIKATGLAGDLEIYNKTDDSVVALTGSLTETDGSYSGTFSVAQDSTDVIVVRGTASETVKSIYDIKRVDDVETAIP